MNKLSVLLLMAVAGCACGVSTGHQPSVSPNWDSVFALVPQDNNMPIDTVCSPDSAVWVYGWDNLTGGQMISWSAVYTVRDDDGTSYAFEGLPDWDNDDMSLITGIYALPHPERRLYLFESYFREWSAVGFIGLTAFERTGHTLRRVPLIRDEEGELVEQVGFEYDALDKWREIICLWDDSTHTFLFNGFPAYRWNGTTLEPVGGEDGCSFR